MILVTGATGFIGSHLVEELVKEEKEIRCLVLEKDKHMGPESKKREELLRTLGVEIFYGDLLDLDSLNKALDSVSLVFHLAAIARPMNIPKDEYFRVNVVGTQNLLKACSENLVKKIVHVSSMSVFGYSRDHTALREDSPKLPVSTYGESKLEAEIFVTDYCKKKSMELVVVRPPMVYGPRDFQFSILFKLISKGFFPLINGGQAKFEFCYVKNLVHGIILANKHGSNQGIYNITDGKTYRIKHAFKKIAEVEGVNLFPYPVPFVIIKIMGAIVELISKILRIHPPFNSGTAEWMSNHNFADISKAKTELGFKRKFSLSESVKETVEYYANIGLLETSNNVI